MMQAIRTRAGSFVVKALFGLLVISFGFWGVYTRSPYYESHSPDTVIATVGDRDIRAEELQKAIQPMVERLRAQFGGTLDQQQIRQLGIPDAALKQLIDRALVDQETRRLGLAVPDTVIRNAIYQNPALVGPDGKFDRQMLDQLLAANHLTEDQLVTQLRRDIPRSDLLQSVTAGVTEPRAVVDALYRYRNEKRVADIVEFPAASITGVAQPSDADLQKFYDAHKDQFRAPEFRSLTVASLSPTDLKGAAPIPDDKLRAAYEERKDDFGTPEQRDIQQILAPSEAVANEAEAALKAGKDWKEVATTIAKQDPDTIDLGLLSAKEIPHELGDIAFQLALNTPSQPVKSPLGWHILRVVKIDPATTQTFEQAKPKLEDQLKLQDAMDRLDKIGNEADDALAGGAKLADVAAKFGLKVTNVAAVDEGGKGPDGKPAALPFAPEAIVKTAFSTNQGETSRVTDTSDGAIFAVLVDKVSPPDIKPLAEVKDQAVAAWQAEQKRDQAQKQAKALAAAVTPSAPLAKAAGDKGVTLLAGVAVSRTEQQGQSAPPDLVAKLFTAKPGEVVSVDGPTGSYVAQLKEIQSPKTVPDTAAATLSQQLSGQARVDLASEYTDALRKRFPVDIKRDALDKMF